MKEILSVIVEESLAGSMVDMSSNIQRYDSILWLLIRVVVTAIVVIHLDSSKREDEESYGSVGVVGGAVLLSRWGLEFLIQKGIDW